MRKFLYTAASFAGLVLLIVAVLNFFVLPRIKLYTMDFERYHARVAEACADDSKPRLFLLGGSNLGYGIEDDLMTVALKDHFTFVNMGLDAGMGLGLQLSLIDESLRAGDCIVLANEYAGYDVENWNGGLSGYVFRCDVLNRYLATATWGERWSSCNLRSIRHYVFEKMRRLKGIEPTFKPPEPTTGGKTADYVSPFQKLRQTLNPTYAQTPVLYGRPFVLAKTVRERLRRWHEEMSLRHVRVLVSAPTYDVRHYALHQNEITSLWSGLTSEFGRDVISCPEDYVFPLKSMCDSPWHVNHEASVLRTRRLISELRGALDIPRKGNLEI